MKKIITLSIALSATTLMAHAQFNIGINGGLSNPQKAVLDSVSILRSGYAVNIAPSYSFGKFSANSSLGYQSFNTKSGFQSMVSQKHYTADKGYSVSANSPGFYNAALGAGFNLLPVGVTGCGVPKPSLIISSQFGVLKPVNPTNATVSISQKATIYSLSQSNKALPYFNAGADVICPLNNLIALKSGVSYNQSTSNMQFEQSSNGSTSATQVAYSNVQFTIGIQFSFKGISEKGVKRAANNARVAGQPIGGIVVKGGVNGKVVPNEIVAGNPIPGVVVKGGINAIETNPLYNGNGGNTTNPMFEGSEEVAGQPIGGIVVKGGRNPGGSLTVLNNGKPVSEKGISEKGVKRNDFAIKENGIKSMSTPNTNQKGIQEKGMKTQAMIYTSDFSVEDPMLLSYLGTSELIIKKGEYAFDYSKNPNGELKLQLSKKIVHRDLAARNLIFVGFNPDTKTHFEYTIEPEYVNGVANQIVISYKGISEKGVK